MPVDKPLANVTIIELGHIIAGPFCGMLLADLGAKVVKVEAPETGEALRGAGGVGKSMFNYVNRNKKSVTIDLKTEKGLDIWRELVEDADVLIENFSAGTAADLGAGYEAARAVNPSIVYCSINGFNPGPYEGRPALDPIAEALSGLMSTTGYPGHPPARAGTSVADMTAALYAAMNIIAELLHKEEHGEGQKISTSIFESTVALMGPALVHSDLLDEPKAPLGGGGQNQWIPYDVYETDDDKWIFIGVTSEKRWDEFSGILGLNESKYDSLDKRTNRRQELDDEIRRIIADLQCAEVLKLFEDTIVPVAPVQNTLEVLGDPHLNESKMLKKVKTADSEHTVKVPGNPVIRNQSATTEIRAPPELGEHTEVILEELGFSRLEIARLAMEGII